MAAQYLLNNGGYHHKVSLKNSKMNAAYYEPVGHIRESVILDTQQNINNTIS
jgi:hypothetical protein